MRAGSGASPAITIGHTIYAFKEGGMERGLLNIVNYGQQDRFRHIIICLTEAGSFARLVQSTSCRVVELHKRPGHDWRLIRSIADVAREFRIDILHARGWPTLVETAVAARLAKVKATLYGFHGKTHSDLSRRHHLRRLIQSIMLRMYGGVLTLNSRMQADLAAEAWLPPHAIRVIANGVDVRKFQPSCDVLSLRRLYDLPVDRFIVGNVARLDEVKNHAIVLDAMAEFNEDEGRPYFVIVGDGEYRAVLEEKIVRLGLQQDVKMLGYMDSAQDVLNCLDVYVQSSHYEGFSNTILEAMACGLPVVATDVGGTRDVLFEGEEGLYFSPTQAGQLANLLRRLWLKPAERKRLGLAGRRRAIESFSVERMVEAYEALYASLPAR